MHYKPWKLIDANGTAVNIAATTTQAELRIRDPRNTQVDILYLDNTVNAGLPQILHGAIGWKPQQVFIYPRFPEGSNILGKFGEVDPVKPASGDLTGYYTGLDSPYEEPTDFIEYVIPPKIHVGHEFYNYDSVSHQPVANILFALYHFQPLLPILAAAAPSNRLIRDIALRHVPAAYFPIGYTSDLLPYSDVLRSDWGVAPISLDDAANLQVE